MLITLSGIYKGFLDKEILKNVSLSVNERDRIGLLGINGVGKTTLLNILCGKLECDEGSIAKKPSLKIGYLKQNEALNTQNTLEQEINSALSEIFETRKRLDAVSEQMSRAAGEEYTALSAEYERLTNVYNACDGYNAEVRINTVLNGMGFGDYDRSSSVAVLSGGEKTRFALAKILVENPELLILDEPTNHLDFSMLNWLEEYLSSYKGAVITVSHDRYFLDSVAKDICELENCSLTRYHGGYSSYLVQKDERVKVQLKEYEKQQKELEKLRDYVSRNLAKSSSTNSVGSRVKALERAELLEKPNPLPKELIISFPFDIEPHKTVLECRDLSLSVGKNENKKQLFSHLDLIVERGEKIAFVGKNGVGKSSFLKAILKKLPYEGVVRWGGNVKIAYFDQELASLDLNMTVLEAVHRRFPTKTEYEIRSMLARFLIEDEDVFKRVREMSGANRAKTALCIIAFERANVLVLDEPTNHLDYKAKEALQKALYEYEGTLIMVSHDRYLLSRVPDKIAEMTYDGVLVYNGNYEYYKEHKAVTEPSVEKKAPSQGAEDFREAKKSKAEDRKRRARLLSTQRELEQVEEEINRLQAKSAADEVSSDYQKLTEVLAQLKELEGKKDELESLWLELSE